MASCSLTKTGSFNGASFATPYLRLLADQVGMANLSINGASKASFEQVVNRHYHAAGKKISAGT